jgi:hypothetical protein
MLKINEKISVIIPAFNEAKNIGRVLEILKPIEWIDEIIVVNDASDDKTAQIVQNYKIKNLRLISHPVNLGKGGAMATGIEAAKNALLLFLDSDLVGLKQEHMLKILSSVVFSREADLSLGVFSLKKWHKSTGTKFANRIWPGISGQRAIYKKYLPPMEKIKKSRYGVDLLITRHVPKKRRAIVALEGLSQILKEGKSDDPVEVIANRIKMYQEVSKTLKEILADEKRQRS